ncbi:CPBP family intramembrane glutamic endopeptidase [Anaerobacillus sp. MEB173]|uniref:CPBP family intramembrane glutamic endopeptidase n=1 Tax=Anaerobacillus sp. MEB173 TaxID=3383345 RepID=UPI003F8EF241
MARQSELIKNMTDKELLLNVYVSQLGMLVLALVIGFFLFDSWSEMFELFIWDPQQIVILGGGLAAAVIIIELILIKLLPKDMFDDGGINEKVFINRSISHIFVLSLVIAFAEEILFRGVLQTHIGLVPASILFALIHVRYLGKVLLFSVTVILSFLLGWLFYMTNNLLVPIFCHFLIDFVLGLLIRLRYIK